MAGRKPKHTTEHDEEIERLYVQEKMSLSKIAQKFNMNAMTIKRKLIKRGVEIRGISVAMSIHHLRRNSENQGGLNKVTGDLQIEEADPNESWLD